MCCPGFEALFPYPGAASDDELQLSPKFSTPFHSLCFCKSSLYLFLWGSPSHPLCPPNPMHPSTSNLNPNLKRHNSRSSTSLDPKSSLYPSFCTCCEYCPCCTLNIRYFSSFYCHYQPFLSLKGCARTFSRCLFTSYSVSSLIRFSNYGWLKRKP